MLDNLINLVRQNAGDAVISNPSIPNDKNEAALQGAGSSILSTLQSALSGGKLNDVLGYFKNGGAGSSEIVQEATGNYSRDLQSKLGLNEMEAQDIAGKVIPQTMTQLANKTTDPSDSSFNIQDIFNNLSGGKTSGINLQEMLNKFGGAQLDKDGDGNVDMQDLKSMFSGGGSGVGGILDSVKGLFK